MKLHSDRFALPFFRRSLIGAAALALCAGHALAVNPFVVKDVRVEEENGVLVVLVEERPAISTVDFTGTKEFEKDVLIKALKEIGVGEAKTFDKSSVERAEQELKRQYLSHGLYGVKVTTTVTPI